MRYETTTKLEPGEALLRAEQFFAGQFGLTVRRHDPQAVGFEGGGGHVASMRPRGRGSAKPCAASAIRRASVTVRRSTGAGDAT